MTCQQQKIMFHADNNIDVAPLLFLSSFFRVFIRSKNITPNFIIELYFRLLFIQGFGLDFVIPILIHSVITM